MKRHEGKRRTARLVAAAVAGNVLITGCFGDGGIDEARRRRKQIERVADPAVESELVAETNALRSQTGLLPLEVHPALAAKARDWSATMAGEGRPYHSRVSDGVPADWAKLAENVGHGMSARSIHEAFVASPRHHANLSDPAFTHVGVGAARASDGSLFVTQVFMQKGLAPTAPPATRTPAPTRPPRPAAPVTAVPPITAHPPGATPPAPNRPPAVRQPSPRLLHVLRQLAKLDRL